MDSHLLHGENHPESRKRLTELVNVAQSQAWEIIRVDGQKGEKLDLNVLSRSQSMLGMGQFVVVENYFTHNKKGLQEVKELFKGLTNVSFVFWEQKTIAPQTVKALEKYLKVTEYKIPKVLFNFLNSFTPGNAKNALMILQKAKSENSPDMLLVMLSRQIRLLYCLSTDPEGLRMADWQKRNLQTQLKGFTAERLLTLHHEILVLDRKNKKSQLPEDLASSLDLLVASL